MSNFNIVGIDPGTKTIGVGVLHITDERISTYKSYTIDVSKTYYPYQSSNPFLALQNTLVEILDLYQPYVIGVESPFFYASRPTAIIPLAKANGAIEAAIHMHGYTETVYKLAPRAIKKFHNVQDHSDKESTRSALKSFEPFQLLGDISEHEVDALCVANYLYKKIYPQ